LHIATRDDPVLVLYFIQLDVERRVVTAELVWERTSAGAPSATREISVSEVSGSDWLGLFQLFGEHALLIFYNDIQHITRVRCVLIKH